jgi:hypothetical protein
VHDGRVRLCLASLPRATLTTQGRAVGYSAVAASTVLSRLSNGVMAVNSVMVAKARLARGSHT